MNKFQLDSRLAADSFLIGHFELCELRLINDSRWPWLVLVPKIAGAEEIHETSPDQQAQIANETAITAKALKQMMGCEKINSAAIGNIVRQLHIHVIARNENDTNWPGPVWGFGKSQPYDNDKKALVINQIQKAFSASPLFSL